MKRLLQDAVGGQVGRILELAQRHLGMDVAYIAMFVDGEQVFTDVAGDADSFGFAVGDGRPLPETYCARMVEGEIPNVIADSAAEPRVRALPATEQAGIGAYVGVPLYRPDGEVYGSFCCLSHAADPDLNARDVRFMAMLGELLEQDLAEEARLRTQRQQVSELIAKQSLDVALQPVIDVHTGRCSSLEALARFPVGSPERVFGAADEVGLRVDLEQLAADRALAMLPLLAPQQALAVNLSPDTALARAGAPSGDIPWHRVILEITEHAAVHSYAELRRRLRPLRDRGLRLAIDDAGAGFASLRHIVELRPDVIKIDRSLVEGVLTDLARRSVVTTFVLLALDIGAKVVAEGVETEAELAAVTDLGVDAVQGYLLGLPSTDPGTITTWCNEDRLLAPGLSRPLRPRTASVRM